MDDVLFVVCGACDSGDGIVVEGCAVE